MIVSILQMMGFGAPAAKPAPERSPDVREAKPQAAQVKSKAKAAPAVKKSGAKALVSTAKPVAKKTSPGQPFPKSAAKSSAKVAPKPAAKPASKTPAKPAKVMSKPAAKAKLGPAVPAKTVSKPAAKPVVSPAKKAATKPTPVSLKKPVAPVLAKTAAKAAGAKTSIQAPQVAAKPAVKPVVAPVAAAKASAIQPVPVQSSAKAAPVSAAPAKVEAPAPAVRSKVPTTMKTVGKTNAKVAPSMASDLNPVVASTAAKASYKASSNPVMPSPVFAVSAPTKKDPKLANNWKNKPVDQLTDAEVLAMSDDDYMNDAQMAFFKLKLTQLKRDILSSAGETTEHLREDTVVVPDPADRATIEEEHALELRTRDRERKLLKKIEQSIARIDAGDYGYCDETGEPIGVGRLLARPTANLSLEAQQRRELKQKMFGD